jgi:hypothetical protein|eukprot:COSAG01_NODE_24033_length_793_cov_1.054755_2_plen_53_part_00
MLGADRVEVMGRGSHRMGLESYKQLGQAGVVALAYTTGNGCCLLISPLPPPS